MRVVVVASEKEVAPPVSARLFVLSTKGLPRLRGGIVGVTVGERVWDRVPELVLVMLAPDETVAVVEAVLLAVKEPVGVNELVGDRVGVAEAVTDAVAVVDGVAERVWEGVGVSVTAELPVPVGVAPTDMVAVREPVLELVADEVCEGHDAVPLAETLTESEAEVEGVLVADSLGTDAKADGEVVSVADCETLPLLLAQGEEEPLLLTLLLLLALPRGEREGEGEALLLRLRAELPECCRLPVPHELGLLESTLVTLALLLPLPSLLADAVWIEARRP
jgi:hypothetical protein